ncbi:hypothetical protein Kfla_6570 [Kribbella flavida DSM 17836]|uniref:Lipoprotein n=1 Tax=Kribbella flavida (strain DSM 17836 / JCM 10339 / NBRC 14399) TaxID=479435 RepID=D2PZJ9_KRIFD|nr:hypothetical protein [Kribbella flavida]ADB35565.1 hypothetical protein Kfla_6570 [Kribbella flavida DSM 17836]
MRHRPATAVVVLACLAGLLTACGPRGSRAQVGLTVDDAGKPVLVLQDCKGEIEELGVQSGSPGADSVDEGDLRNDDPAKGITLIPFPTGGNGWEPADPLPALHAGEYTIQEFAPPNCS